MAAGTSFAHRFAGFGRCGESRSLLFRQLTTDPVQGIADQEKKREGNSEARLRDRFRYRVTGGALWGLRRSGNRVQPGRTYAHFRVYRAV